MMNNKNAITYRKADPGDIDTVTGLLFLLYDGEGQAPGLSRDELADENRQILASSNDVVFLAFAQGGDSNADKPVGVSHGSIRREYVNGANDGPKGYLEAIYVLPEYRLNKIATGLVRLIEKWAAQHGCREVASDCLLDNTDSYRFHISIGYEETERNIFFLKAVGPVT